MNETGINKFDIIKTEESEDFTFKNFENFYSLKQKENEKIKLVLF